MTPGISGEQQKLLNLLSDSAHEYKIIFDLRQNSGGSDDLPYAIGQVLRAKSERFEDEIILHSDSLLSLAGLTNTLFIAWQQVLARGQPANGYRSMYEEFLGKFNKSVKAGKTLDDAKISREVIVGKNGSRENPYGQPIAVLVDKSCVSSCERMIKVLCGVSKVKVFGTNTGGALHFGDLGSLRLPKSEIIVRTCSTEFDQTMDALEGKGYAPDFYALESDGLTAASGYLRALALKIKLPNF